MSVTDLFHVSDSVHVSVTVCWNCRGIKAGNADDIKGSLKRFPTGKPYITSEQYGSLSISLGSVKFGAVSVPLYIQLHSFCGTKFQETAFILHLPIKIRVYITDTIGLFRRIFSFFSSLFSVPTRDSSYGVEKCFPSFMGDLINFEAKFIYLIEQVITIHFRMLTFRHLMSTIVDVPHS